MASKNFPFLSTHNAVFLQLAEAAERNVLVDPNTCLIKLRQLAEAFAQHVAAKEAGFGQIPAAHRPPHGGF